MIAEIISFVSHNQVLSVLFGGSMAASLLYALKSVPGQLWSFFLWRFTSHVVISNDDAGYELVTDWICRQEFMKKTRHLKADAEHSEHENVTAIKLAPGFGRGWFKYNGKYILIDRSITSNQNKYGRSLEYIELRALGSPAVLRSIVDKAVETQDNKDAFVEVYTYSDYWMKVCRKEKRALESVVLPTEQKSRILKDLDRFLVSKEWYKERGIPYRRGLMLTGEPGTGKTSLVLALAGHYNMPIFVINLASMNSDETLLKAVVGVPEKSILLFEDIDAAQADRTVSGDDKDEDKSNSISLSGLLNAIDGVFSRDGRILVMTTNHPEKLDKALMRPGRADLIEELLPFQESECVTMCKQFLNGKGEAFAKTVNLPITAAELQKQLIQEIQTNASV